MKILYDLLNRELCPENIHIHIRESGKIHTRVSVGKAPVTLIK